MSFQSMGRGVVIPIVFYAAMVNLFAQADTVLSSNRWTFSGAADFFYAYDFNRPTTYYRQPFLYNHNRHDEVNLNHGFARLTYQGNRIKTNVALHAGTYVLDNYANEPDVLKFIFEANVRVLLDEQRTWWIEAGILPSHIGFESAVSMDNATLTRSLLADNSPYYMTGIVAGHALTDRLEANIMMLTGWQTITMVSGSTLPAWGSKVSYTIPDGITINWSTFVGTVEPDALRTMRYFSNLYAILPLGDSWKLITGFDIGWQQREKFSNDYDTWYSAVMIMRYAMNPQWAMALRGEYYADKAEVIIENPTGDGFNTFGVSLNLDYHPVPTLYCRLEGRLLNNRELYFLRDGFPESNNPFVVGSIGFKF
ncbi:MAG: porin [Cyclobacteriaceae bacterium]|jgi:hypothetical protein|nr:porin [Cyclobacteriaceae bacterium]